MYWATKYNQQKKMTGTRCKSETNYFAPFFTEFFGFQTMSETKKDQNWRNPRKIFRNPKSISTFIAVLQIWAASHERQIRESSLKSFRLLIFRFWPIFQFWILMSRYHEVLWTRRRMTVSYQNQNCYQMTCVNITHWSVKAAEDRIFKYMYTVWNFDSKFRSDGPMCYIAHAW